MKNSIYGIVPNLSQVENIVDELKAKNFYNNDISVLFTDQKKNKDFFEFRYPKPTSGAAGIGTGGVIGGTLGWLIGVGSLAIPGLGAFIAAGPLMAALSGIAVGATLGGLVGTLMGLGLPEWEAKRYERQIQAGGFLVSVYVENAAARSKAQDILEAHGANHILYSGTLKP